jgi:GNAT superfamily N-acetyltransferase
MLEPVFVCRPALPADTPAMRELASHIWDGEDYLPWVWADWLQEIPGLLAAAEFGGRLAAVGKLTQLSPGQWWLEGLRVHPDFEGRGFASHMTDFLLGVWQRSGAAALRLVTHFENFPIHHICEKRGFLRRGEYTFFRAEAIPAPSEAFTPLRAEDLDQAISFLCASESLEITGGMIDLGWQYCLPAREAIEAAQANQLAWLWRNGRGMLSTRVDEEGDEKSLAVQAAGCAWVDLSEMMRDLRRLTAALGFTSIGLGALTTPTVQAALAAAGFRRSWDGALYLFEKTIE